MKRGFSLVTVYVDTANFKEYMKGWKFFARLIRQDGLIELHVPKEWISKENETGVYQVWVGFADY